MVAYDLFFSPSTDIDLLALQASLCSDIVPLTLAPAIADRIHALPVGHPIAPADIAWCVAGALGSHSLLQEHRDWARDFLHVRTGQRCPSLDGCSLAARRALTRHRSPHVRSWAIAATALGQRTFRISYNTAVLAASPALRVVRMTDDGWTDGSCRPLPGAWASPEDALANVAAFKLPVVGFTVRQDVSMTAVVEMLLAGGPYNALWHWPAIVRLIGNANAFRLAVRHDRMDDAAPWLALTSPELVELCEDANPEVRTAVVTATSADGLCIDGRKPEVGARVDELRHPSRRGKRM
jgi:hypothetical protein